MEQSMIERSSEDQAAISADFARADALGAQAAACRALLMQGEAVPMAAVLAALDAAKRQADCLREMFDKLLAC